MRITFIIIFFVSVVMVRAQEEVNPVKVSKRVKTEFAGFYKGYRVKRYEKFDIDGHTYYRLTVPLLKNRKRYIYPVFSYGVKNGKEYAHLINNGVIK